MSMSIPFVWQEVVWQPEWGLYRGGTKTGNIIVDGGMLSNFPIRFIATLDDEVRSIMGDTDPGEAGNLGLMIDETIPVPGAPDDCKTPQRFTSVRTIQRVSRLLDTMRGATDNEMIRRFEREICRLPEKNYGTLEFDMEGERLRVFLEAARTAMRNHLASPGAVTAAAVGRLQP
jgi:predicted acylesterase/phospholipase RssA